MSDKEIEQEIQAKGLTAPRVTPADIEACIASEHYFTASEAAKCGGTEPYPLDLLTFCVLVLRNGFTVTGESACASPENFDAELGRQIARRNAEAKIWPLMGYELRNGFTVTGESACASPENFDADLGKKIARQNAVNKIWPLEGYLLKERLSGIKP